MDNKNSQKINQKKSTFSLLPIFSLNGPVYIPKRNLSPMVNRKENDSRKEITNSKLN